MQKALQRAMQAEPAGRRGSGGGGGDHAGQGQAEGASVDAAKGGTGVGAGVGGGKGRAGAPTGGFMVRALASVRAPQFWANLESVLECVSQVGDHCVTITLALQYYTVMYYKA